MTTDGLPTARSGDGPRDATPAGVLGPLPRLTRRQVALDRRLGLGGPGLAGDLVAGWNSVLGGGMVADQFAVEWRAAGLRRPGVVAHLAWPRLRSRVALGVDPPLAHAVVDRLLGFERSPAEARLQVSPVEWGILSFLIAGGLERLDGRVGPLGPWDLTIDRVGPDPFDAGDLGSVVTWRWRVRVGALIGSARLWLPESLIRTWLDLGEPPRPRSSPARSEAPASWRTYGGLASEWHAELGTVTLGQGTNPDQLLPGQLYLLDDAPLAGTVASPVGPVALVSADRTTPRRFATAVEPGSAGDRLIITAPDEPISTLRTSAMAHDRESPDPASSPDPSRGRADLPVTLAVELGRINLTVDRLAGLGPGDVIDLNRPSGGSVDLISNGQLVARGELVQVDTELAIRITQVYL